MSIRPCNVLFLCTGNSARSILFAATLNHFGSGRFAAFSAGSQPLGRVNPFALGELAHQGMSIDDARSKSWDEFSGAGAPALDVVITVCDSAAQETCPVFFGEFAKVHWGLPDPSHAAGTDAEIAAAFHRTELVVIEHVKAMLEVQVPASDREGFARELDAIHERIMART